MRFVFVSYVSVPGFTDPEAWLFRIRAYTGIPEALARNHEVISIEPINCKGERERNGVKYIFRPYPQGAIFPNKLHRLIKSLKPDIVLVHSLHFPLQVIQLRLFLGSRVKIIVQNHAEQPFTGLKKRMAHFADTFVNAYLFASKEMGMDWVSTGNLAKGDKIHEVMEVSSVFHPIDKQTARRYTGIENDPAFLWVGRLNQNKDPLTVVKAFLRFTQINPAARLYMIYQTEELLDEIKSLLAWRKAGNAVLLLGKISNEQLLYWYNAADFIVSGSHYEGSGTAVCEGISCGCIPVVTNIASFKMMTNDGKFGLLYPAGDEEQLYQALLKTTTIDMAGQRQSAIAYFNDELSFGAIAGKIEDLASTC